MLLVLVIMYRSSGLLFLRISSMLERPNLTTLLAYHRSLT